MIKNKNFYEFLYTYLNDAEQPEKQKNCSVSRRLSRNRFVVVVVDCKSRNNKHNVYLF